MFDYLLETEDSSSKESLTEATVWSRLPLAGVSASALTPFSSSVLTQIVGRSLNRYYDRLGFEPPSFKRLVRELQGHTYINVSAIARLESQHAGVHVPQLRMNGQFQPLVQEEKRGLFSGFTSGRSRKRMLALQSELGHNIDTAVRKASYWLQRTREMHWTQADVLQIMEEVERTGIDSMMTYLAARLELEQIYNRLFIALDANVAYPTSVGLMNGAVGELHSLVEMEMAAAMVDIASELGAEQELIDWLDQTFDEPWHPEQWASDSSSIQAAIEGITAFLDIYGHRSIEEAEMAGKRWLEHPDPVLHSLKGAIERHSHLPPKTPKGNHVKKLLDALDASEAKSLPDTLKRIRELLHMQSHALHALAYIWAGTREWAKAAAHEAVSDGRLQKPEDIFFFELEEIKQLMTGEWNISDVDGIRTTAEQRKTRYEQWCATSAPPLLVNDEAHWLVQSGLPASEGTVTAPLRKLRLGETDSGRDAILGVAHLSSGWAIALPVAKGFVAAEGTPLDPCVAAAREWNIPTVILHSDAFEKLVKGAQTTLDGGIGTVDQ